jgi:hypothetical protein
MTRDCLHCDHRPECKAYCAAQIEACEHCEAMGWYPAAGERLADCPMADSLFSPLWSGVGACFSAFGLGSVGR